MIGNDIIDLRLAAQQSNWQREGFLDKLFTVEEQEFIGNSNASFEKVWRLWSMKETAYKALLSQNRKRLFAPKRFECIICSDKSGYVAHSSGELQVNTVKTPHFIYSSTIGSHFSWIGDKVNKDTIVKLIEEQINLKNQKLSIQKDSLNIPHLFLNAIQISQGFTLSHHGSYLAFEYCLL